MAAVALQAPNAARAAATARSTSAALASATSASWLPSCGLVTAMVAPSAASTNSPPMNSRVGPATIAPAMRRRYSSTGYVGSLPLEISSGSSPAPFSQTSSIDRLGA